MGNPVAPFWNGVEIMIFFKKKEPKAEYYFEPQPDISAYALAIIVKVLPHWGGNMVYTEKYLKKQGLTESPIFHHFKRI